MANEQNLTQKEKKEFVKTAREFALAALNAVATDKDTGNKYVVKDAMIKRLITKAISDADLNAIKYLFELIGESPADANMGNDNIPSDINHGINIDSWIKDKLK